MASTTEFSRTLSLLRQERGVSQRTAAAVSYTHLTLPTT